METQIQPRQTSKVEFCHYVVELTKTDLQFDLCECAELRIDHIWVMLPDGTLVNGGDPRIAEFFRSEN